MVKVLERAPDFKLNSTLDKEITLSEYKGRWVVLFFYTADFTGICGSEVVEFGRRLQDFQNLDAAVLGVSVDSVPAHKAWLKELGGVGYPLLSDINKEASRSYGVLLEDRGQALRGVFIIDPNMTIRSMMVNDTPIGRSIEEVLRILQALKSGERCPAEWRPKKP